MVRTTSACRLAAKAVTIAPGKQGGDVGIQPRIEVVSMTT
jgi:hypothetical protein